MRILAEQERRFLSEDAQSLAYAYMRETQIPGVVMEKALLDALLIGRTNNGRINSEVLEYLIVNEYEIHCSAIGAGTDFCRHSSSGC